MSDERRTARMRSAAAVAALAIGLGAGGYGIASAASGGSGSTSSGTAATTPTAPQGYGAPSGGAPPQGAPQGAPQGWGPQRSDETPLTGEALAKVTAAAKAEVPGGTIVRVETDADGVAKYEAHMTKSDGSLVTVFVDASYNVVSVQTR